MTIGRTRLGHVAVLCVVAMAAVFTRTAVGPLQEQMRSYLEFGDNQIALLQGLALTLPVVLGVIPLGLMIDRSSRVRLLLIFTLLNLTGSVLTALASGFSALFAARCLVGFAATATATTVYSLLADFCGAAQRGRATTLYALGQYAGMSAAFAIGGKLLTMMTGGPNAWRWAMLSLASVLVPIVVVILAMREPPRSELVVENPSWRDMRMLIWRYRALILPLLLAVILAEVSLGAALTWAAPALVRSFGLSAERMGEIMSIGLLVSGVLGPIVGGALADICQKTGGPSRTLSLLSVLAIALVPTGMFAFVSDLTASSILLIAFLALGSAIGVMGTTLFTIVIPNEMRGLCVATLFALCLFFSVGLGSLAVSLLSGLMGGPAMIGKSLALVGAVSSLLAALAFAFGKRNLSCVTPLSRFAIAPSIT